jgi:hypothetical protein
MVLDAFAAFDRASEAALAASDAAAETTAILELASDRASDVAFEDASE